MRRLILAPVLILAAALTGCGVTPSAPSASAAYTPPATVAADTTASDDRRFADYLRSEDPYFAGIGDDTLVEAGRAACGMFDDGYTLLDYFDVAEDAGVPVDTAATVAAAAVVLYCPRHSDIADGY